MSANQQRKGFTFIELLFVIVILGIVGGMTLEAVRQYYNGIYRTQEIMKRTETADHVLDQLKGYFEYALDSSIVNLDKQGAANACYGPPMPNDSGDYTVAFVAVDQDSLRTIGNRPGWSSEVLLGAGNTILAADANFTAGDGIITGLGSTLAQSAVYDADSADNNACVRFNLHAGDGTSGYHKMDAGANPISSTILQLNPDNNATDGHRKYLLRTGYAFQVEQSSVTPNPGNFYMYTSFRPWLGEEYKTDPTKKYLLAEKVNHFFVDYDISTASTALSGKVWRLKVCMQGLDENLSDSDLDALQICRERSVHVRY
ncbi:MAG: type II secretion system protein [Campylobacterales bacterium]|nr:type II secretion system protein [Campylobacterales bacterium]